MATTPAPSALAVPTTAPPAPVLAPATPTPPTAAPVSRRAARTSPPTRVAYTRHAATANGDDRIITPALNLFYKIMAWAGGAAIVGLVLFGGFQWGKAAVPISVPQVIYQPSPAPAPTPHWPSRDECEDYYVLTLHEAPGNRCNN
jgi:hypothetical protein